MRRRNRGTRPPPPRRALVRLERADRLGEPTQAFEPVFAGARQGADAEPLPLPPGPPGGVARRRRFGAVAAILGVLAAVVAAAVVVLDGGEGHRRGSVAAAGAK